MPLGSIIQRRKFALIDNSRLRPIVDYVASTKAARRIAASATIKEGWDRAERDDGQGEFI